MLNIIASGSPQKLWSGIISVPKTLLWSRMGISWPVTCSCCKSVVWVCCTSAAVLHLCCVLLLQTPGFALSWNGHAAESGRAALCLRVCPWPLG